MLPRPPSDAWDHIGIRDPETGEWTYIRDSINDDVLVNPFKSQEYSQITLSGFSRRYDDDELGSGSDEIYLLQL